MKVLVFLLFFNLAGVSWGEELGLVEETEKEQTQEKEDEVEIIKKEPIETETNEKKEEPPKENKTEIKTESKREELVVPAEMSLVEEDEKCTIEDREGLEKVRLNEIFPFPSERETETGRDEDWIELYNFGTKKVNLEGCYLVDGRYDPNKKNDEKNILL